MPQSVDLAFTMHMLAAMLGLAGIAAGYVYWRDGKGSFFRMWFDVFSKWLGAAALYGLLAFSVGGGSVILGSIVSVIVWGGLLFVAWGLWRDP